MATRTTDHPPAPVRARVADSWVRSAAAGVLAETVEAPVTLGDHDLRDYREAHPLAAVFPLLDDVLGQSAREWTLSWPSPTRPGSCCGCAARRPCCVAPSGSASSRAATGTSGWPGPTHRAWRWRLDEPVSVHRRTSTSVGPSSRGAARRRRSTTRPTSGIARGPRHHRRRRDRRAADHGDGAGRRADGRVRAGPPSLARQRPPGGRSAPGPSGRRVACVIEALGRGGRRCSTIDDGRGRRRTTCA